VVTTEATTTGAGALAADSVYFGLSNGAQTLSDEKVSLNFRNNFLNFKRIFFTLLKAFAKTKMPRSSYQLRQLALESARLSSGRRCLIATVN